MRANEKVALVTGAARGLGRSIAERLIRDGFTTVLNDVADDVHKTADELGCTGVIANIAQTNDVRAMSEEVSDTVGPVAVLVNNAGINQDARLVDMTDRQWRRVLQVNLTGTFKCIREFAPGMIEAGWGRIINMSSVGILGNRNTSNYAASKTGVVGLTRSAALEFAGKNITVNAIAPGVMDTDMLWNLPERISEGLQSRIPAKRVGQPAEVAGMASFLASEDAAYVTGQTLFVDGGISLCYA